MSLIPPLPPNFEAALRDVGAIGAEARLAAARRLADPPENRSAEAERALRELQEDPDPRVRAKAIAGIGWLAGTREDASDLVAAVAPALLDPHPLVREAAAIAIGKLEGGAAIDILLQALDSEHPEVRFQAVTSLAAQAPDRAVEAIGPLLADPDPEVRANACSALGDADDAAARDPLAELLDDAASEPRREAALALAKLGDTRGAIVLRDSLGDPERALDVAIALGAITDSEHTASIREALGKTAGRLLGSLHLRAAAGASLHRLGDARGIAALRSVLRAFRADARSFAVDLVRQHHIVELATEIARLVDRPRGADPDLVAETLVALADDSAAARGALARVANKGGRAAEIARAAGVLAR